MDQEVIKQKVAKQEVAQQERTKQEGAEQGGVHHEAMSQEVRTKFRAKELAIVLSYYDLGAIHEIHSFRRGNIQSPKSVIVSEKGTFLLKKRAPGRDDPYRVAMAHELQLYLARRGFCVPRLVGTIHSHTSMLQTHGGIYELFEFIAGDPYDGSTTATRSAGHTLKWLHSLLIDYHGDFQVPTRNYHDCSGVRKSIQQLAPGIAKHESAYGKDAEIQALSVQLLEAYEQACHTVKEIDANHQLQPCQVCHGDWHPGNMVFRGGEVIAVLDYDGARAMVPLADVANGCLQFSLIARGANPADWPEELDIKRARNFLQGYQPQQPFNDQQWQCLVALMIEALIAEAVTPIAATGRFANIQGFTFLQMVGRKVRWLQDEAPQALPYA